MTPVISAASGFLIAAIVAYALTPLTGRLALHFGVIDHPSQDAGGHKQHATATPYLGGIAIVAGLMLGSLPVLFLAEGIPIKHFALMIAAGLLLGLVGLADDVRPLPRTLRLTAQIAVAIAAYIYGFGVSTTAHDWIDISLTILWIVGITNAFNLLDNMDGVSAGLAGIAALTFAAMGLLNDLPILPTIAASLSGAALGFLKHNRHPAKVFMGDAGSLFLGFLVGLLAMRLRFDAPREVTFLVPVVVLGIPILDTALVVFSRLRHQRPVFLGGRDHIAHRLVMTGLSTRTAVYLMYLTALCLGWIGLVISRSPIDTALMLSGFVLVLGFIGGAVLWRVPVYAEEVAELDTRVVPDLQAVASLGESDDGQEEEPTHAAEAWPGPNR